MVKTYKAILSVLLVVLVAFAVITVTGVVDINKMVAEKNEGTTSPEGEKVYTYEDDFNQYTKAGLPLLSTDFSNIFYTMDTEGAVNFYKAENNNIEEVEETGNFDVEISVSGAKIPATVHYLEKDGKTVGYGLFTNKMHPEVKIYEYAFFKVTNQFPEYSSDTSKLLLLVDIEQERIYDENKVYSESFYLDDNKEVKVFLNEDQRIIDMNARLRTDYKMFTDRILHQPENEILFFSSRSYNDYEYSSMVDIYKSRGYGENVDNNRYIRDIASLDFWQTDDGTLYFSKITTENEAGEKVVTGFALSCYDGENTEEVKTFEGTLENDYILTGDWLLKKSSGEIYNVVTGEEKKLDYSKFSTSFIPDVFKMSENGEYCVVRGQNNLGKPSIGVMSFKEDSFRTYTDNVFGYVVSVQVLNDGTFIISVATGENTGIYYQLVGPIGTSGADREAVG